MIGVASLSFTDTMPPQAPANAGALADQGVQVVVVDEKLVAQGGNRNEAVGARVAQAHK